MSKAAAPVVSFEDELLIVVDEDDRVLDHLEKAACHDGEGILHRAFSVFLFDRRSRLLLTQRSDEKRLWPGVWSNTCCSHPRKGEGRLEAAQRRTAEELGLEPPPLEHLFTFAYRARYDERGSEHEVCGVFAGRANGDPKVNPREITDWRWIDSDELDRQVARGADHLSPWLRLEWPRIRDEHWSQVSRLVAAGDRP